MRAVLATIRLDEANRLDQQAQQGKLLSLLCFRGIKLYNWMHFWEEKT